MRTGTGKTFIPPKNWVYDEESNIIVSTQNDDWRFGFHNPSTGATMNIDPEMGKAIVEILNSPTQVRTLESDPLKPITLEEAQEKYPKRAEQHNITVEENQRKRIDSIVAEINDIITLHLPQITAKRHTQSCVLDASQETIQKIKNMYRQSGFIITYSRYLNIISISLQE